MTAPAADSHLAPRSTDADAAARPTGVPSNKARWAGRILSGFITLFLTMDTVIHLLAPAFAVEGTVKMGYAAGVLPVLGAVQLGCLVLYLVPRTAALGALLWTGYLGGAVATHVRVGDPLFSHILAPVYVATLLWLGLWLRDARVRALFPVRASA
jgi:hypothetical protein